MDADSLTNKFWEGIQTLSLADTIDYIDDPNLLLQPKGKVVCIRNNTGPHDLKALEALLRLHRYSFLHSPTDIVQSYRIALSSLSLADEPGHACLFFLLSSHSWDLFERTKQLQHLTNAIDLLSDLLHFLGVEQLGTHVYSVVSVVFACICMQFCLKEGEKEARETAIEALEDARREASSLKWVSSTRTRTVVVIADIMRYRYEEFGPQGGFNAASVDILMSILDTIPTSGDSKFQFTALEILTTSLIFQLSKERDASTWHDDLRALNSLASLAFSTAISPTIDPPTKETLEKLATSLRQCKTSSYTRPVCLIFTADHLDSHEEAAEVDVTAQSSQIEFSDECEKAREHLVKLLNLLKSAPDAQAPQKDFQIFRVIGKPEHRVSQARVRFLQIEADEGHICMFNFTIIPVEISEEEAVPLTHVKFARRFRTLAKSLPDHELNYLVQYPSDVHNLFAKSRTLGRTDEQLIKWRESPAIMAYILFLHARRNHKQAGHMLHTISLDKEPGHTHFLYQLAASIRETETDEESLDLAAMLLKEFLRVQERGTPLHFLGVVELASTLTLEFLHRGGRLASFAVALELFREATATRFSEPWHFVAKKTLVIGRVLHNRYRFFEEPAERLEEAMNILDVLWDIIPLGHPFRVSVVELIVISALLYLSHDLDTTTWLKALKHLTLAVDLHVNGFLEEDIGLDNEDKADIADIVLHDGVDPSGYFCLSTQAMCIVHTADLLRATAYDACRKPGYLRLATDVYKKSLKWRPEGEEIYEAQSSAVAAAWTNEKESLRRAVLALGRDNSAGFTLGPNAQSLPVFWYRAVLRTSSDAPKSFSHSCHLLYHPTWVTYLPKQQNEGVTSPLSTRSADTYVPPWPADFMFLPSFKVESLDRSQRPLPSTILPGIEKVIEDENSELFKMPLEPRTIRAFMRSLDDEVRGLEKSTSYMSESVIRWSNEPVYWDPKEVHLSTRMAQLKSQGPYFARLAQLQALLSRGPERCLELVESSRTLFWNRLLRLQTSFAGLPEDLASSLEQTANELDRCKSQFTASATEEDTKRQWELEGIFNSLLGRARQVPGFEKFLMPKGYEELLQASAGGPVVVLLGNDSTYAALVVRPTGVDVVWLTDLTDAAMEKFIVGLNRTSKDARSVVTENREEEDGDGERKMGPMKSALMPSYEAYLSGLWKFIAKPVLEFLGLLKSKAIEKRPRLWWCPTARFTFLPIHAAGINFGKDTFEGVMKYVVSSYTPTLSALITCRNKMARSSRAVVSDLSTLVLTQSNTPGHASLPMTLKELGILEEIVPPDLLLRVGEGTLSEANVNRKVDEAMKYIEEAAILHLACHGHQDRADPLNSGFELSDGRLSLSNLISCRNPNAFLAFLSACESAANDVDVPDESLNLAAAMLFAGFRSVIGTM